MIYKKHIGVLRPPRLAFRLGMLEDESAVGQLDSISVLTRTAIAKKSENRGFITALCEQQ